MVGLLPLAFGQANFGMALPPFLIKQLYRCDSIIIVSVVVTGYTSDEGDSWVEEAIILYTTTPCTIKES